MALRPQDFDFVSRLARDSAAIVIEPGKEYLVENRLSPLAAQEGFASLSALIDMLRRDPSFGPLHVKVVDALTTNETYFFRDFHPFETLRKTILPELLRRNLNSRQINIWSAACSTGQEPYSIAMILREMVPDLATWKIRIVGTDINQNVLLQAKQGVYNQLEVNRGLPAAQLIKHFSKEQNSWRIKDEIRNMVEFRQLNLIDPFHHLPRFDLVFIRNVMIYFDIESRRSILTKIRDRLHPTGHLFLGTAETTANLDPCWQIVSHGRTSVFIPRPPASQA